MKSGGLLKKLFLFTGFITFIAITVSIIVKLIKSHSGDDGGDEFFEEDFEDDDCGECGYAHETDFEKE